jgi:photosystem II oxygen-evolving enhancer protein 3
LASLATIAISLNAVAVTPVDLKDDRKAKSTGFDLIYEARDLDLPQNVRDGLTQARGSIDDTKKRVAESRKRITQEVLPYIKKAYWVEAKEALRLQVGTLRFDLNTLAGTKPKADKKAALAAKKQFFNDIEKVDFAIREKKLDEATKAYNAAVLSLDAVLAKLL